MAKKKTARESCLFCDSFPCQCDVVHKNKYPTRQGEADAVGMDRAGPTTDAATDTEAGEQEQPDP